MKFTYYCAVLHKNMSVTPPGMMIHVCCGHNEIITLHSAADLSYVMYQITVSIMHGHRLCVCN
jgi:hypothetical protein